MAGRVTHFQASLEYRSSGEAICSILLIRAEVFFSTLESRDAKLALANRGGSFSTEESP